MELFDRLKQLFGIRKGAFLTRGRESSFFLPLAQTGLDVTSRNRLRLPVDAVAGLPGGAWFEPTELSFLAPYISSREFALCEGILGLVILTREQPAGLLLLLAEDEEEFAPLKAIPATELRLLQESLGAFFERSKLFQIAPASAPRADADEILRFIDRLRQQERQITALRFALDGLLRRLSAISTDIDLFRARKDTLRIIETLFEGNSKLLGLGDEEYLLVLGTKHKQNPGLLEHQVGLALQNFFSDDQTRLHFVPVDSPETLVDELLQHS